MEKCSSDRNTPQVILKESSSDRRKRIITSGIINLYKEIRSTEITAKINI